MTSRKKPGVAFWATVALVVALVGYPLSIGPAWWLQRRVVPSHWMEINEVIGTIYRPLWRASGTQYAPVHQALLWYTGLFVTPEGFVNPDGWHGADGWPDGNIWE